MVRATYQRRLSAIILGIRPSAAHLYGNTDRVPVDNVTQIGVDAWRLGLEHLLADLVADHHATAGEQWIKHWIETELSRDATRWSDASTMLELLAISLGPASGESSLGPKGRLFWTQWQRNIAHLAQQLDVGAASPSSDSTDLLEHCEHLVEGHGGPAAVLSGLASIGLTFGPPADAEGFRPLTSAVERLQLSVIVGSAYDPTPPCKAAMARLIELRPPVVPCAAAANRRHRLRGARYHATRPDH